MDGCSALRKEDLVVDGLGEVQKAIALWQGMSCLGDHTKA